MSVDYSFVNGSVENGYLKYTINGHFKGVGRMFYIVSPKESYQSKDDVPNYFIQVRYS